METELIVVEKIDPIAIFSNGGMDELLEKISEKVKDLVPDLETDKGRKEIASMAYKVSRSKTIIDNIGKDLVSDWKNKAKAVDVERKKARDYLDNLKAEIREPLTQWEAEEARKEQARIDAIKTKIAHIKEFGFGYNGFSSDQLGQLLKDVQAIEITEDEYQEFEGDAVVEKEIVIKAIKLAISERVKFEKEEAERKAEIERLEMQRQEQEKEAIRLRDEQNRIAKEQAEKEAKLQAEREAIETEKAALAKANAEQEARIEREKAEAEVAAMAESLKPDKEKIITFANKILDIVGIDLENQEAQNLLNEAIESIYHIAQKLIKDAEML